MARKPVTKNEDLTDEEAAELAQAAITPEVTTNAPAEEVKNAPFFITSMSQASLEEINASQRKFHEEQRALMSEAHRASVTAIDHAFKNAVGPVDAARVGVRASTTPGVAGGVTAISPADAANAKK